MMAAYDLSYMTNADLVQMVGECAEYGDKEFIAACVDELKTRKEGE